MHAVVIARRIPLYLKLEKSMREIRSFRLPMVRLAPLLLLVTGLLLANEARAEDKVTCICTGAACGNNAVGGDKGDIFSNIAAATAKAKFQTNASTGWTCVVPAKTRGTGGPLGCFCKGSCGNGGIGADPNYFDIGLTQDTVNKSYGGGKAGNKTGWLCGNYRGEYK